MPRQLPASAIPDDFGYGKHPELRTWIQKEFPQIDPDQTMTRFIDYADDSGRMASKWTACFKRVIRTGVEKNYDGIVVYLKGKEANPKWKELIAEARAAGFREPTELDGLDAYRDELKWFLRRPKESSVLDFTGALRAMGK